MSESTETTTTEPTSTLSTAETVVTTPDPANSAAAANTTVDSVDTTPTPQTVAIPENWKEALDESLRNEPSLGKFKDIPSLVKSYINAEKMIGSSDKLVKPDEYGSEEDWKAFYAKALDIPGSLEEYEVAPPKDANFNDGFISKIKEFAFKEGIAPRQLNNMLDWYKGVNDEALAQQEQEYQERTEAEIGELKKEWGERFNTNVALAKLVAKEFGGEGVFDWIDNTGLGDDAKFIKFLAKIGETLKEDKVIAENIDTNVKTPADLQSDVDKILGDPQHPYHIKTHPNHAKAVQDMQAMFQRLHPPKK